MIEATLNVKVSDEEQEGRKSAVAAAMQRLAFCNASSSPSPEHYVRRER